MSDSQAAGATTPATSAKSWARDTGWLLGANISKTGGLLAILIVLARFTTPTVVGYYALALAITTPIFVFAQLGLKGIFLTHKVAFSFRTYLQVQFALAALASIVSIGIVAIVNPALIVTVALVCLIKCGDAITDLFAGPLQRFGATANIFWGIAVSSVVSAIAAIVVLVITRDLNLTLLALAAVSTVIVFILMWVPGLRHVREREANDDASIPRSSIPIRDLLRAGTPIGAGAALLALVSSLPQYFLSISYGADAVAHFAVLFYTVAVADIFMSTLVQGWIPRAREATIHPELAPHGFYRFLTRTATTWTLLTLPMAAVGITLAWFVIPAVFGPTFVLTFAIAIPIASAIALMPFASFSNIGIIVQNLYLHSITLSVASAVTSLVVCALLIPSFGIAGAFWAIAAASLARTIPSLVLLRRHERVASA